MGVGTARTQQHFRLCAEKFTGRCTVPPNSPIGEARRFAVITKAYVLLRDKPGVTGIVIAYARRKDIFPVLGIDLLSKDKESALWVNVERGWLPWDCVQLYSSKAKALAASKKLS